VFNSVAMTYFFHQIFAVLPFIFLMGMVVKIAAQDCDRRNTDRRNRKQRKAAGGKSGRRPGGLAKVKRGKLIPSKAKTKKATAAKKWFVAPKLSDADQMEYDMYHVKRQFV
jgi:hypothetical protein